MGLGLREVAQGPMASALFTFALRARVGLSLSKSPLSRTACTVNSEGQLLLNGAMLDELSY